MVIFRRISGQAVFAATLATMLAALLSAGAAQAETLRVSGIYPPGVDIAPEVELIVIEPFDGDTGRDVEFKLTELLGQPSIGGAPWFDIISPDALANAVVEIEGADGTITAEALVADAQLRGLVRSEVFERQLDPKIVRDCVKRDAEEKCIEYKETRIECYELTARVDPRIVMIGADGRQIYTRNWPSTETRNYCADDSSIPSVLEISRRLVDAIAYDTYRALAPTRYGESVRIMETRRDLNRADRNAFRDAVRAINTDARAACTAFTEIEATNPAHLSVLFNIGLCWESSSEYERAADYYTRALAVDGSHDYPRRGLSRVRGFQRGAAFVAQREGR